jgi:phosphate-selective porin OprO and OprP
MKLQRSLFTVMLAFLAGYSAFGQIQAQSAIPYFTYGKGLGITSPDSLFAMNIRFRVQNRIAFKTESESDFSVSEVEARVRRLRLRFDGFVYNPKLTYTIQLSFSRGDMDYESMGFPNIIRDAYVQYAVTKNFSVGMGQTKLPGNRQRITSSGDQQLVDRSMVNATFNIDRDFGVQFAYKKKLVSARLAISSGEGRNISSSDRGLAYTGRLEFLPLGAFANNGEYFEGDLVREERPKVAIGLVYSHNENTTRTGGQLGPFLHTPTDIKTSMIDLIYKHNGMAITAEYLHRSSPSPVTFDEEGDNMRFVYVGYGQNYQLSYLFQNNVEIVGRYSMIMPGKELDEFENEKEQFTAGLNKYFKGHRVKLQGDVTLESNHQDAGDPKQAWITRFQIEVGI